MGDCKSFSFEIKQEKDLAATGYDAIVHIHWPQQKEHHSKLQSALAGALKRDPSLASEVAILSSDLPAGRIVLSSAGPLDPDYDDVRSFRDAAYKGVKRALKAGVKKPLIHLQGHPDYEDAELVTLLGALEALHVPIQIRELKPENLPKIEQLGVVHADATKGSKLIELAKALEAGRRVARDIGDADPERMAPPKVQQYLEEAFKESSISLKVIEDEKEFAENYPLFEAVNRAASVVQRHRGRIIFMEYVPSGEVKETVMLVGKGVTYDTGGADIKAGGIMAGMSRDKCGAAAVAGFMKVVDLLKPKNVKIVSGLSMVRNSVGSNCYVADELIKARSGALVRVGNTDAEGRMVMADVLCRMKELALSAVNPHLFTVATLTGHAHLAVGEGYSIVMDNGPAKKAGTSKRLVTAGDALGDPFEVSTIRREDLAFHRGKAEGDDVMQCNNAPSSRTPRGHQGPAAFLLLSSGLEGHGSTHEKPIPYSHLDIAGSGGDFPNPATGAPILALAKAFLL
ncbi:PREDICTED: putative aminopeptidase W07G4.4 [Nicrophorus vespilloides]|uniref:Aminopeptidase W07G4.4 n=1 Tax=Nicrophorus vespilloides TaxID=110193 RepID=A0ABM1M7U2_NICVS|nr:PREDICTED: putative aminopeptidase W07G4.4 [Nicrophorus vespilloides]